MAMTLVEVFVVIGVVAILLLLLLPAFVPRARIGGATQCFSNQRQIGIALRMFADDNNGQSPQVSNTTEGRWNSSASNSAALHFRALSNYPGGALGIWHCPADQSKQPLTNKSALTDQNLSYFISLDATPALTKPSLPAIATSQSRSAGNARPVHTHHQHGNRLDARNA